MATVPSEMTAVAGAILTAAQWNSNVRDAINFLINKPVFEGRQTVAQTFTTAVGAAILMDTEDVDTDGMHSTVTNISRATAQTAGRFQVSGGGAWASNATGARAVWFAVNGSSNSGSGTEGPPTAGGAVTLVASRTKTIFLNVGDYVELFGIQTSGSNLNSDVSGLDQPSFSVRWVGTT